MADENPDVDAIYRLTSLLPIKFNSSKNISLGNGSICPFNSQNTAWLSQAYLLMYLPSYCSFRMTDIWRSFIAQRIAWTCGWSVLFHNSTVKQKRNVHNLMRDFAEEVPGYKNNYSIMNNLIKLKLKSGIKNIKHNMILCYRELIRMNIIDKKEMKNIIVSFIKQVKDEIKQENKINHVEEITQNISIMVVSGKSFLQYLPDYKLMCDEIKNFSTMNPKSYPSLTNKIVFKFMDLDDELDD